MSELSSLSPFSTLQEFGRSLPMQIAEYIAGEIFAGRLRPGDRLKEEELAEQFHTSRAPVREALYLLQIDGLVERLPRRGTVVREYTDREIQELYEVRLGLETVAAERMADHWSDEARASFRKVLADMESALEQADVSAYARQNEEFHDLMFRFSGNEILWRLYRQIKNLLGVLLQMSTQQPVQMRQSFTEHRAILESMERGAFDQAKLLLLDNVRHGLNRALETRARDREQRPID